MGQTAISLSSGTGNYPSVPHTLPPCGSPREGLDFLSTLLAVPPPSSNCVTLIWMPNNYHPDEVIHRSDKKSPRGNLTATDLHCAFVGRMCRNANGCLVVDGCVLVGWFSTGGSWSRMGRRSVLLGSLTIGGNDYATPYVYVIGLEWVWIENKILNFLEIRMTYKQKLQAIDTVMTCSHQDEIWQRQKFGVISILIGMKASVQTNTNTCMTSDLISFSITLWRKLPNQ